MAFRWRSCDGDRGVVTEYSGVVSAEQLARSVAERTETIVPERLVWLLNDYSAVDEIEVPIQTIIEHAHRALGQASGLPSLTAVAFVVADKLMHGLARVWMAHMTDAGVSISLFEDRAAAEDWLRTQTGLELGFD